MTPQVIFGPAGLGQPALEGLELIRKFGLNAAEVEFTYGVRMDMATAAKIGEDAKKYNIMLSIHAPFYINLVSNEKEKIAASIHRIMESCERGKAMGAKYVVFHPGFYQGKDPKMIYEQIRECMQNMQNTLDDNDIKVQLAPETTGKGSQFGTLDELLKLRDETKCHLCVDFAHILARNNGKIDYDEVFSKLKSLKHIHSHFSGINYTAKGERNHELLTKKFFMPLAEAIKSHKPDITVINESPDPLGDAIKMKQWFEEL